MRKKFLAVALVIALICSMTLPAAASSFSIGAGNQPGLRVAPFTEFVAADGYYEGVLNVYYTGSGNTNASQTISHAPADAGVSWGQTSGSYNALGINVPVFIAQTDFVQTIVFTISGNSDAALRRVTVVVPALSISCEHDWDEGEYVNPSCAEDGYTVYTCLNCDETYSETDEDTAFGHTFVEGEYTDPTCAEDGFWALVCDICGEESDETEADEDTAFGHTFVKDEYTDPTCEKDGFWALVCDICGEASDETEADEDTILDHDWDDGVITTQPTAKTTGVLTFTCSICLGTRTEEIPALGHHVIGDFDYGYTSSFSGSGSNVRGRIDLTFEFVLSNGTAVTRMASITNVAEGNHPKQTFEYEIGCDAAVVTVDVAATRSGSTLTFTVNVNEIFKGEAAFEEVIEAATCVEEGELGFYCEECGELLDSEAIEIDPDNHAGGTFEDVITPAIVEAEGEMGIYCADCNELLDTRAIPRLADYSAVEAAIAAADALDKNLYVDFSGVTTAINAVVYDFDITGQTTVDGFAAAINAAVDALVFKPADYSAVEAAIAEADALDKDFYVDFTGVTAAIDAVVYDLNITQQNEVNDFATAINAAVGALVFKPADYSAVDAAIAAADALDKDLYVDFGGVTVAIDAVVYDLDITEQSIVDEFATAINAAVDALVFKPADYSAVEAAIAAADALDKYLYVDFGGVTAAIGAVVYDLNINYQITVDGFASAINAAIGALVFKPADYSAVEAAIAAADALDKDLYIDFSAVTAAINAVVYDLDINYQTTVDGFAAAINAAIDALVYKAADYTAVEAAIAAADLLDKNLYIDFGGVTAAIGAVVYGLDITEQTTVDDFATAINAAINALVFKPADYSGVEAAIAAANALDKDLYVDFGGVTAAIDAVVYDFNITQQNVVNDFAAAINAAIGTLVLKPADYSAVEAAIAAADALDKDLYVNFGAVTAAINAVVYDLDITEQTTVDGFAAAINAAIDALVYKAADYTAVEAAIAAADALDKDLYVNFGAVTAAINAVVYGLDITEQTTVDGFAAAINAAVNALVLKPTGVVLVGISTSAKNFVSITETAKNSRVWTLKFNVVETYSDGTAKVVAHSINLNGNNANLDGKFTFADGPLKGYTLVYDIKGNGSNIKDFKLIK